MSETSQPVGVEVGDRLLVRQALMQLSDRQRFSGAAVAIQADVNGGCIYRSDPELKHLVRLIRGCMDGFDIR